MIKKIAVVLLLCATTTAFAMSIKEVNKASKDELMQINGIGEKKADAIIKERKKNTFKSFEDLEAVKGVGPSLSKNIKNDIHKKSPKKSTKKSTDKKSDKKVTKKSDKKKSEK